MSLSARALLAHAMDPRLAVAASLAVGISLAHSYLGEWCLLMRLFRRDDLPTLFGSQDFTRRTLRFARHITRIAWIGMAAALVWDAQRAIALAFGASALSAGLGSRGRHYSWLVFGAIALLAWPW